MLRKTIVSCAALVSLAGAVPANADVIKVPCRGSSGGPGGLIRAIRLANSTTRSDTIRLARRCRYVLTDVDNNWYGPNGLPAISSPVTVKGRGAVIARSRARGTPAFRLFFVGADPKDPDTPGYTSPGPGRLTLREVTLTGGLAMGGSSTGGGGGAGFGGAIFSQGEVRLQRSTLAGNVARGGSSFYASLVPPWGYGGGGIGQDSDPATPGTGGGFGGTKPANGVGSTGGHGGGLGKNRGGGGGGGGFRASEDGGNPNGGGPSNGLGGSGGKGEPNLSVRGAGGDGSGGGGGGGDGGGTQPVRGGDGGGFGRGGIGRYSATSAGPTGGGGGGGVGGGGGAGGSTVGAGAAGGGGGFGGGGGRGAPASGSSPAGEGGAGGFGGGGGGRFPGSGATPAPGGLGGGSGGIGDQYLKGGGGAGMGGAVFSMEGELSVENSTLSKNRAIGGDGALGAGGAIADLNGVVTVRSSTLALNAALGGNPNGPAVTGAGAAIAVLPYDVFGRRTAIATIHRSILSPNSKFAEDLAVGVPVGRKGARRNRSVAHVDVSDHNLIRSMRSYNAGPIVGSPMRLHPLLGPLQDNGGPTPTRLPKIASPAIDAGGASGCPATDQRAVRRPQQGACDIGAVEFDSAARITEHPARQIRTASRTVDVSFAFRSDMRGATFECSIDARAFKACGSPKTYRVGRGQHTFEVRARGSGHPDPRPARFSFQVGE